MDGYCESCGKQEIKQLIYFNDSGPTFVVCSSCAISAGDHGCSVFALEGSEVEA